jgi:hypothetical protein
MGTWLISVLIWALAALLLVPIGWWLIVRLHQKKAATARAVIFLSMMVGVALFLTGLTADLWTNILGFPVPHEAMSAGVILFFIGAFGWALAEETA